MVLVFKKIKYMSRKVYIHKMNMWLTIIVCRDTRVYEK